MALVTVQRSPSPSTDLDSEAADGEEGASGRSPLRNRSLSESYFTVRGAALILPQGERPRRNTKKSHGGDIQHHLQSMLYLLRHEDRIKVAVRLEAVSKEGHQRYMALVSTVGRQDTEESVILGIDYLDDLSTIGLVLPIYNGTQIMLDGDGGFFVKIPGNDHKYLFKPVSVQAMWSALQSLQKAVKVAEDEMYIPNGLTHTWVQCYTSQIDNSKPELVTQWNIMEGVEVSLTTIVTSLTDADDEYEIKAKITNGLTAVMMKADLDLATSRSLREAVEETIGRSIKSYRAYFDSEMMRIFGQMDSPSQILDFLYLGTEWNASNIDELNENGVKYILNVTREIDNFFPGQMKYMNVRVYDVPESQLMPHWDKTYRFISKAKKNGAKVLVHCKRGISRSASTVIAYLMKENNWSLDDAFDFVDDRRNIINPNRGFMDQLRTYEGILNASNQRHIFKSKSAENILDKAKEDEGLPSDGVFLEGADLYRQMFDSTYPRPASEEEVLQSLGRGGGLEEDDMVRIGTDLETGSRSTDSLEESLPDIPSPTPDQQEFTTKKRSSSKGEYTFTTQYDNAVATSGEVAGLDIIRHENTSDVEDEASVVRPRGRQSHNSSPVISISESGVGVPDLDIPQVSSQSRLRPDNSWIKLETENKEQTVPNEATGSEPTQCASPPIFVIGDDFSSTLISESGNIGGDIDRQPPVLTLSKPPESKSSRVRSCSLGDGKSADDSAKGDTDLNKLSVRNRAASLGNRKVQKDTASEETIDKNVETVDSRNSDSGIIDQRAQLGITQYYTSEQIPWCPGTVQKMKSDFSRIRSGSDEESDSAQNNSKPEKAPEVESNVMEVTGPPLTAMGGHSVRLTQSCIELPAHDDETDMDVMKCSKSVYEEEDIEFAEGMVRMVKKMFQVYSEPASQESRPIQRSASLKEERESLRTKRSERRKTCSPILSPRIASPPDREVKSDITQTVPDKSDNDPRPTFTNGAEDSSDAQKVSDGEGNTDKTYTVIKYGSEEVPLEKGLVKKHKQDFESRTDHETRKRLSSECSVSSVTVDLQDTGFTSKDEAAVQKGQNQAEEVFSSDQALRQSEPTSASSSPTHDPVPSMSACDNTDYSNSSVVSERLIGTVKEQTSILESKETSEPEPAPITRAQKKTKKEENSSVDPQTLAKMREFGSELLNQPKIEKEEENIQDLTLVRQVVRNIEKDTKVKKPERKIIIIEEDAGKKDTKSKAQNQPLSEKSRSLDNSGSIGAKRTRQWVRDGGSASFEGSEFAEKESRISRVGLSLNLDQCSSAEGDQGEQSSGESISPRSESEPSIVRHLVGRFEKDIKSPMSETADGTGSNRSSLSVGEFGLCFTEARKKKDDGVSQVEMRPKSSGTETALSRPVRPKSADHISRQDLRSQSQGQGQDNQPSSSQSHIRGSESSDKEEVRKVRRIHGQTKPVVPRLGASPFYNTM